jgi:signal transduction histidine kinase
VKRPPSFWKFIELLFPWLVLTILSTFTYAKFFVIPYCGFDFNSADGEVTLDSFRTTTEETLRNGDQLIQIGSVSFADFQADLRKTIFDGVRPGQIVPITVLRDGEQYTIQWVFPDRNINSMVERAISLWWLPYVFWFAGVATLYSLRPKDTRWRLLLAFYFVTAIWLAAGNGPSHWHIREGAIIMRVAVWLCLPIYLHLHWVFPAPLRRLPPVIIWGFYLLGIGLAVAQWFQMLDPSVFYYGFLLAVIGSMLLLLTHAIFRPEQRRDLAVLLFAIGLVVLPVIAMSVAYLFGTPPLYVQGGSFLALPALPGAYFFAVYRQQFGKTKHRTDYFLSFYIGAIVVGATAIVLLTWWTQWLSTSETIMVIGASLIILGTITAVTSFTPFLALPLLASGTSASPRQTGLLMLAANRFMAAFLFVLLTGGLAGLLAVLTIPWLTFTGARVLVGVVIAYLAGSVAIVGFEPFQRWVEHRLLGMPLPSTGLLETYTARITTSLEMPTLVHLLSREILPSLLVRQSALLQLDESGHCSAIYSLGVEPDQIPAECPHPDLLLQAGQYRSPDNASQPLPWVRLALVLKLGNRPAGLWLLGHRDPDDFYAATEITTLQAIANQTAIALANIRYAERLNMLYQINIERQEAERKRLALELHDDVLNQMAILSMNTNQSTVSSESAQAYQTIISRIRSIIGGLRPPTLNFGLGAALEELADQVAEQAGEGLSVSVNLEDGGSRYAPDVELHLFRIAQQACQNALRHAQASHIQICGSLQPEETSLSVIDDGLGFDIGSGADLGWLLAHQHYGLVGMQERGALIGASVQISSASKEGTRVQVTWKSDNYP